MNWKNVYIFISSTFNDMHSERDFLIKKVFPELAEWCEKRFLHLVDVDLRWGVSEKDAQENKRVVEVCLDSISECRPLFLCFLGQRRGWIPSIEDLSESTIEKYPLLKKHIGKLSVTELEIMHAIYETLDDKNLPEAVRNYSFFFHRNEDYLESLSESNPNLLTIFKENSGSVKDAQRETIDKLNKEGFNVIDYSAVWDPDLSTPEIDTTKYDIEVAEQLKKGRLTNFNVNGEALEKIILDLLKEAIATLYPEHTEINNENTSSTQREQEYFITKATETYIEQTAAINTLNDYLESDINKICVINSSAGTGKTTLLARIIQQLQLNNANMVHRIIGASEEIFDEHSLINSIFNELVQKNIIDKKDIPLSDYEKKIKFQTLINQYDGNNKLVIIIDGLDQLRISYDDLFWLPARLSKNIKMIVSYKDAKVNDNVIEVDEGINPFTDVSARNKYAKEFFARYLKDIDDSELNKIVNIKGTENPLFLKVLLSELRIYGSFESLAEKINSFNGISPEIAFENMLQRMETDPVYCDIPAYDIVPLIFGQLSVAKNGLTIDELSSILEISLEDRYSYSQCKDAVVLYFRQINIFLAKRNNRVDFRYDSFKSASLQRYSDGISCNRKIAMNYFESKADVNSDGSWKGCEKRAYEELIFYMSFEDQNRLKMLLRKYRFLEKYLFACGISSLVNAFSYIANEDNPHIILKRCLQLSNGALSEEAHELPAQLWGRLCENKDEQIQQFLSDMCDDVDYPWIKSIRPCLVTPNKVIESSYPIDGDISAVKRVDDNHIIIVYSSDSKKKIGLFNHSDYKFLYLHSVDAAYLKNGILKFGVDLKTNVLNIFLHHTDNIEVTRHELYNGLKINSTSMPISNGSIYEISPDCKYVTIDTKTSFIIYDIDNNCIIKEYSNQEYRHHSALFSNNSQYIAIMNILKSGDNNIDVINLYTKEIKRIDIADEVNSQPRNFQFSEDSDYLEFKVWESNNFQEEDRQLSKKSTSYLWNYYSKNQDSKRYPRKGETWIYSIEKGEIIKKVNSDYFISHKLSNPGNIVLCQENKDNFLSELIAEDCYTVPLHFYEAYEIEHPSSEIKYCSPVINNKTLSLIYFDEKGNVIKRSSTEDFDIVPNGRAYNGFIFYDNKLLIVGYSDIYVINIDAVNEFGSKKNDTEILQHKNGSYMVDLSKKIAIPYIHTGHGNPYVKLLKNEKTSISDEKQLISIWKNSNSSVSENLQKPLYANRSVLANRLFEMYLFDTSEIAIKFGRIFSLILFDNMTTGKGKLMPILSHRERKRLYIITPNDIGDFTRDKITKLPENSVILQLIMKKLKNETAINQINDYQLAKILTKILENKDYTKKAFSELHNKSNGSDWLAYLTKNKHNKTLKMLRNREYMYWMLGIKYQSTLPDMHYAAYDSQNDLYIYPCHGGNYTVQSLSKSKRHFVNIPTWCFSNHIIIPKYHCIFVYGKPENDSLKYSIIDYITGETLHTAYFNDGQVYIRKSKSDDDAIYFFGKGIYRLTLNDFEIAKIAESFEFKLGMRDFQVTNNTVSFMFNGKLCVFDCNTESALQLSFDRNVFSNIGGIIETDNGNVWVLEPGNNMFSVENIQKKNQAIS